jgi:hypothetical protein
MYFYSISNVCGTKQQNRTKWRKKVSITTPWFTYFCSFSSVYCVSTKRQKFFIFIWLDRALITLSNCIVFIWFISYLDREFNEVLKAPKKSFSQWYLGIWRIFSLNKIWLSPRWSQIEEIHGRHVCTKYWMKPSYIRGERLILIFKFLAI